MQRDLLHWDQALFLAKSLAPTLIPVISMEYAQQLEFKGKRKTNNEHFFILFLEEYASALDMYNAGANGTKEDSEQYIKCKAGVARMSIRLGDFVPGISMIINSFSSRIRFGYETEESTVTP